jgi:hypothetical protein
MLMRRWALEVEWSGGRPDPVSSLKPIWTLVQFTCRLPCADSRHQVIRTHPSLSPLAPSMPLLTYIYARRSPVQSLMPLLLATRASDKQSWHDKRCTLHRVHEDATRDTRDVASFVAA